MESLKRRLSWESLKRWHAFYLVEPFGQEWSRSGRSTEIIRAAMQGGFDRNNEERFLPTYQPGDEFRTKVRKSPEEIAAGLAMIPGLKKTRRAKTNGKRNR